MIIFTQHSQTNLNPHAPEYFPSTLSTPHNNNLPPPFYFYPPLSPPVINIFYHHQIFPHFTTSTSKSSSFYCTSNTIMDLLPAPKPAVGPTRLSDPGSAVVRRVRRLKGSRVHSSGSGSWFWVKKDVMNHPVAVAANYPFGDSTSLMIRNIPVRYSRKELMELLEEQCRVENEKIGRDGDNDEKTVSEFDFLYLPIDFKTEGNMGYAFVNFTTWQGAARLYSSWNGTQWLNCPYKTRKIRQINRAKYQGKQELKKHFQSSVFACVSDEFLPVVISPPMNGVNSDQTILTTIGKRKSN